MLRITPNKKIDSFVKVLVRPQGITNHHQNIQILMVELFKVVNNLSTPITDNFLTTIRGKHYDLRGFEEFVSEEKRRTNRYGLETNKYPSPKLWSLFYCLRPQWRLQIYLNSNQKLGIGFVLSVLAEYVKYI